MDAFLTEAFGGALLSALLTDTRQRDADGLRRVTIRPVLLRGKSVFQFEYQYAQKVQHKNLNAAVRNRQKNYLLPEDVPVDFLVRLGVMTAAGSVVAAKRDKFKQINRFLEMVGDAAGSLPTGGPLRVVDFGCGKAYLTFALYYYLSVVQGREVEMIGLDLKEDVVAFCTRTAAELSYSGLSFAAGDIEGYQRPGTVDMVVTLHACDTATDDALTKAIQWGASVILSVPCCQHELFGQLQNDALRPLLKHGILKERLTALVTDSVRASLLESAGYSVQILEFIALEYTAKNLLIRAVKRPGQHGLVPLSAEYEAFRDFWHIRPHLEAALKTAYD